MVQKSLKLVTLTLYLTVLLFIASICLLNKRVCGCMCVDKLEGRGFTTITNNCWISGLERYLLKVNNYQYNYYSTNY